MIIFILSKFSGEDNTSCLHWGYYGKGSFKRMAPQLAVDFCPPTTASDLFYCFGRGPFWLFETALAVLEISL